MILGDILTRLPWVTFRIEEPAGDTTPGDATGLVLLRSGLVRNVLLVFLEYSKLGGGVLLLLLEMLEGVLLLEDTDLEETFLCLFLGLDVFSFGLPWLERLLSFGLPLFRMSERFI